MDKPQIGSKNFKSIFAKKELKYVPILGFNLIQMGHVLVDRGKGKIPPLPCWRIFDAFLLFPIGETGSGRYFNGVGKSEKILRAVCQAGWLPVTTVLFLPTF